MAGPGLPTPCSHSTGLPWGGGCSASEQPLSTSHQGLLGSSLPGQSLPPSPQSPGCATWIPAPLFCRPPQCLVPSWSALLLPLATELPDMSWSSSPLPPFSSSSFCFLIPRLPPSPPPSLTCGDTATGWKAPLTPCASCDPAEPPGPSVRTQPA